MKLSLLLELKNNASPGVSAFIKDLQKLDKQGQLTLKTLDKIRSQFNKKIAFGGLTGDDKPLKSLKKIDIQAATTLKSLQKVQNQLNKQLGSGGGTTPPKPPKDTSDDGQSSPRRRRRRDPYAEPPSAVERLSVLNDRFVLPARQTVDSIRAQVDSFTPYFDSAMRVARAQSQFKLINLSPEENARAFAAVENQIKQLGLVTRTEGTAELTNLHTAFGHLDDAISTLPLATKYRFSMESLFGDKFSPEQLEAQIQNTAKFLELTGKVAKGQPAMQAGFNTVAQITAATGGRLTGADFLNMAKTGGTALQGLSTEGLRNISAIMQELGGQRTGTSLMSMYQGLVGGQMKQSSLERFNYFGLLDKNKVDFKAGTTTPKAVRPGANLLGPLMMEDPLKAADKLAEAFQAKGMKLTRDIYGNLDEASAKAVNEQLAILFQNRTAQRLMSILMTQRGQVMKESGLAKNAKDVEGMYKTAMDGPGKIVLWEKALERFREQAGGPLLETLTKLVTAAQPLMKVLTFSPTATASAFGALILAKSLLTVSDALSMFDRGDRTTRFRRIGSDFTEFASTVSSRSPGVARELENVERQSGKLKGTFSSLASSGPVKMGIQIIGLVAAGIAIDELIKHIQAVNERAEKTAADIKALNDATDAALVSGDSYGAPGTKSPRIDAISQSFFNSIDESGMLKRQMHPEKLGAKDFFWYLTEGQPYGNSKFGSSREWGGDVRGFGDKTAARRWEQMGLGQIARDPNTLATVLRQLPTFASEKGLDTRDMQMLTAAIENLTKDQKGGDDKWKAVLDILSKDAGGRAVLSLLTKEPLKNEPMGPFLPWNPFQQPVNPFGSIPGLKTPWNIQPFKLNQPTTPFGSRTPNTLYDPLHPNTGGLVDLLHLGGKGKGKSGGDSFDNLIKQVDTTKGSFADLDKPMADTGEGLSKMLDPAEKLPTKFSNIGSSADTLVSSLNSVSERIGNIQLPNSIGNTSGTGGGNSGGATQVKFNRHLTHRGEQATKVVHYHHSPKIIINGSDASAKADFAQMLDDHSRHVVRIVRNEVDDGRKWS